jgi:hypothetical protein
MATAGLLSSPPSLEMSMGCPVTVGAGKTAISVLGSRPSSATRRRCDFFVDVGLGRARNRFTRLFSIGEGIMHLIAVGAMHEDRELGELTSSSADIRIARITKACGLPPH